MKTPYEVLHRSKSPISEEIRQVLRQLQKEYAKTVEEKNLHINLKFFGELSESDVERIKKVMDSVKAEKFSAQLKCISAFPNKEYIRVLWIGVESPELEKIKEELDLKLEEKGFNKERDYIPHVTLARIKKKPDPGIKDIFTDKDFGMIDITEISLMSSTLAPEGPEYSVIHSVKLE